MRERVSSMGERQCNNKWGLMRVDKQGNGEEGKQRGGMEEQAG